MSFLESFRKQTIEKSIQLASQRITTQRRIFSTTTSADSSSSPSSSMLTTPHQKFTQEHVKAIATNELNDFGSVASISTPAMMMNENLVSSTRVTSSASASSRSANGLLCLGLDDGSVTLWSVPDGGWLAHGFSSETDGFKFAGYATRGVALSSSTAATTTTTTSPTPTSGNDFLLVASTHRNGVLALWKFPCSYDDRVASGSSSSSVTTPSKLSPFSVTERAHNGTPTSSSSSSSSSAGTGKSNSLRQCAFSPTAPNILATTGDDGTVKLWSISDERDLQQPFLSLENGQSSFSCSSSSLSSVSSLSSASAATSAATPATRCLSFHPDGAILAVGDASGSFSLWDLRDASRLYNSSTLRPLHSGRVNDIAMSSNGYNFCSGGDDGLLYCFDLRKLGGGSGLSSSSSSPSSTPYVWRQAAHGDAVTSITYGKSHSLPIAPPSLSIQDSSVVFSGGLDGLVLAWDAWTGEELWRSDPGINGYVPGPKIGRSTTIPAVRTLCYCSTSSSSDASCSSVDAASVLPCCSRYYLAVVRREPQWWLYSSESGSYMGNRSVVTNAQMMNISNVVTAMSEPEQNRSNNLIADQKDDVDDSDDDDDDILGALRKK